MKKQAQRFDAIESRAAAWLARRDGGMTAEEAAEFARWCDADPRHAAAVREIESAWAAFDRPVATGKADSVRAQLCALDRRDRRRWRTRGAAAAGAIAACLAVYLGIYRPSLHESVTTSPIAATARVSEPERRTLPDGSFYELKPGAEIAVAFNAGERRVILSKGEAHFSVAKNLQRPFIVEAGTVKVRAVGTSFAVQLGHAEVGVLVTEGKVAVSAPPLAAGGPANSEVSPMVRAGQRTSISLAPAATVAPVISVSEAELIERLAWRVPRLEFSETTIAEAASLFNQRNRTRLVIGDDTVAAMRVTGVFRADNIEGFVRALEMSLGLRSEHGAGEVRLHRVQ